jgi:hypothetical protein
MVESNIGDEVISEVEQRGLPVTQCLAVGARDGQLPCDPDRRRRDAERRRRPAAHGPGRRLLSSGRRSDADRPVAK